MARRVTRVSRGIRMPQERIPVEAPPSVRDRVVDGLGWPEGVPLDEGILAPMPEEATRDVPWKLPRSGQRQEISTRRRRR